MASEVPSTSIESGPTLVTVTVAYCGTAPFGAPEGSTPLRSALDPVRIEATVIFSVRGLPLPEDVRGVYVTVAVWPTVSPVPGLVTPAVAVPLVVAVELAAAGVAPPE